MKFVAPVRQELGQRTIFNLLGGSLPEVVAVTLSRPPVNALNDASAPMKREALTPGGSRAIALSVRSDHREREISWVIKEDLNLYDAVSITKQV